MNIIESVHRHDWVPCQCGASFIDGGHDYVRAGGPIDILTDHTESTP